MQAFPRVTQRRIGPSSDMGHWNGDSSATSCGWLQRNTLVLKARGKPSHKPVLPWATCTSARIVIDCMHTEQQCRKSCRWRDIRLHAICVATLLDAWCWIEQY